VRRSQRSERCPSIGIVTLHWKPGCFRCEIHTLATKPHSGPRGRSELLDPREMRFGDCLINPEPPPPDCGDAPDPTLLPYPFSTTRRGVPAHRPDPLPRLPSHAPVPPGARRGGRGGGVAVRRRRGAAARGPVPPWDALIHPPRRGLDEKKDEGKGESAVCTGLRKRAFNSSQCTSKSV